jgi:hemerythrin superfamily protein
MPRRTSGTTTSAKTAKKQQSLDAIAMLKEDHRKVEQLFDEFRTNRKQDTARQIFKELEIHAVLEEELFYPALQQAGDQGEMAALEGGDEDSESDPMDQTEIMEEDEEAEDEETAEDIDEDVIASAYEEHQSVKELIQRLKALDSDDSEFQQGMVELQEMVKDHVDEEEDVLFPEAKLKLDTKAIATQMHERKQELMSSIAA